MTTIKSIIAAFVMISAASAFAGPVQARETHDNGGAVYASYSPAMAARGERFYVGH